MPIKVLPDDIAIKIAAGEVVERPASVIKELVDNAVDAGAKNIRVEVRDGGREYIRIVDDGGGIPADQLETAFLRHATSKIAELPDLFEISTLGFRGEALPSIASVSRTTMVSRTADDPSGNEIVIEGGVVTRKGPRGTVRGTILTVEDLFYNVPARLKFLKSATAENGQISGIVSSYALAYPAVKFTLTVDNRTTFQSPGSGELIDAIAAVYGNEVAKGMLPVGAMPTGEIPRYPDQNLPDEDAPLPDDLLTGTAVRERRGKYKTDPTAPPPIVWGYTSQPGLSRANRQYMHIFVNHRPIESRSLGFAITEAYRTLLMTGRFPIVVLNVELDPRAVDANVHPSKIEVKFQDERGAFVTVQKAVRAALADFNTVPEISHPAEDGDGDGQPQEQQADFSNSPVYDSRPAPNAGYFSSPLAGEVGRGGQLPARPPISPAAAGAQSDISEEEYGNLSPDELFDRIGSSSADRQPVMPQMGRIEADSNIMPSRRNLPALRVIGQVSQTYVVAEGPDGMYMVDQHAAHERIMYERILGEMQSGGKRDSGATQPLLTPIELELTPRQIAELPPRLNVLADLGFAVEVADERHVAVGSVPAAFKERHEGRLAAAVLEVLDDLLAQSRIDLWRDTLAITLACHSAIRAGQTLSVEEMRELISQLEACQMPRACAHGRPTMLLLSQSQLEREFKRTGAA